MQKLTCQKKQKKTARDNTIGVGVGVGAGVGVGVGAGVGVGVGVVGIVVIIIIIDIFVVVVIVAAKESRLCRRKKWKRSAVCSAKKARRRWKRIFCCRALRPSKSETLVSERERDESNLVALQVNDKGIRYSTEVFGIR